VSQNITNHVLLTENGVPMVPSCRKLEFRLSALMDSNLAWVNGKSGRQSWRYAGAFQRSIIWEAIYHFP